MESLINVDSGAKNTVAVIETVKYVHVIVSIDLWTFYGVSFTIWDFSILHQTTGLGQTCMLS